MNSRVVAFAIVVLLAFGLFLNQRSVHRENAELGARVSQLEEQLAGLNQAGLASEAGQLRAENTRLQSENRELRASLAEFRQATPVGMDPRQRVMRASTQSQENAGHDPLSFYRRNPELMKRYFPQLYKAEMEKKTEEIPAPPKE